MTETEHLKNTLRMQLAWIKHWKEDARFGLRPTLDSLADAEDAIVEALNRTRTLEVAE